ncbi:MAG: alpha-ribazole phosphatase [Bacteroidota bacterium]
MEVYLVRHTTPDIAKGICYGQSDIPLAKTFLDESKTVLAELPDSVDMVYSSPLQRCFELAQLIPHQKMEQHAHLMEMDFGDWEMKPWSGIPKHELDPWMEDFVNHQVPNGESMTMLSYRVNQWYKELLTTSCKKVAVVTHAGPIRVILSIVNQTPLALAFEQYPINYGQVIALDSRILNNY